MAFLRKEISIRINIEECSLDISTSINRSNFKDGCIKTLKENNIKIHFHSGEKQQEDQKIIELMKSYYTDENIKK